MKVSSRPLRPARNRPGTGRREENRVEARSCSPQPAWRLRQRQGRVAGPNAAVSRPPWQPSPPGSVEWHRPAPTVHSPPHNKSQTLHSHIDARPPTFHTKRGQTSPEPCDSDSDDRPVWQQCGLMPGDSEETATRMRPPPMPGGRLAPTEAIPARLNGTAGQLEGRMLPPSRRPGRTAPRGIRAWSRGRRSGGQTGAGRGRRHPGLGRQMPPSLGCHGDAPAAPCQPSGPTGRRGRAACAKPARGGPAHGAAWRRYSRRYRRDTGAPGALRG